MRCSLRSPIAVLVCAACFPLMANAQDNSSLTSPRDDNPAVRSESKPLHAPITPQENRLPAPLPQLERSMAVLYVNGTLNTGSLTGSGVPAPAGQEWSENPNLADLTQANVTRGLSGGITSTTTNFRLADEIVVPAGQLWRIDSIAFYAYVTGSSTTTSPFLSYNLQIWFGRPGDLGSTIVFGDSTTNRMQSSTFVGLYRVLNTLVAETPPAPAPDLTRPIYRNTVSVGGLELPEGEFWFDWQSRLIVDGAHFAPPIAIPGLRSNPRYNARQRLTTFIWQDALDAGVPAAAPDSALDFPFIVYGLGPTSVGEESDNLPTAFALRQNYPNPFNPSTRIEFGLPEAADITLTVYDVLGRQVLVLLNETRNAGIHQVTWNGSSGTGTSMSSGVYVYRLEARTQGTVYTEMKKMILMK